MSEEKLVICTKDVLEDLFKKGQLVNSGWWRLADGRAARPDLSFADGNALVAVQDGNLFTHVMMPWPPEGAVQMEKPPEIPIEAPVEGDANDYERDFTCSGNDWGKIEECRVVTHCICRNVVIFEGDTGTCSRCGRTLKLQCVEA